MSRPPLNSALFNMREIAKQLILLEDHLTDDDKYCDDCIRKHLMAVEAYAEEALNLEPGGMWAARSKDIALQARRFMVRYVDGDARILLASDVRMMRKDLVALIYDPRNTFPISYDGAS